MPSWHKYSTSPLTGSYILVQKCDNLIIPLPPSLSLSLPPSLYLPLSLFLPPPPPLSFSPSLSSSLFLLPLPPSLSPLPPSVSVLPPLFPSPTLSVCYAIPSMPLASLPFYVPFIICHITQEAVCPIQFYSYEIALSPWEDYCKGSIFLCDLSWFQCMSIMLY